MRKFLKELAWWVSGILALYALVFWFLHALGFKFEEPMFIIIITTNSTVAVVMFGVFGRVSVAKLTTALTPILSTLVASVVAIAVYSNSNIAVMATIIVIVVLIVVFTMFAAEDTQGRFMPLLGFFLITPVATFVFLVLFMQDYKLVAVLVVLAGIVSLHALARKPEWFEKAKITDEQAET